MGTDITGARANMGLKLGSTWGTAGTIGVADGIEVLAHRHGENAEEITASPIGSGDIGTTFSERGATSPTWGFDAIPHYDAQENVCLKQFWGGQSIVSYAAAGAFCHSYVMQEFMNQSYVTHAFEVTTQSLIEYPSAVITHVGYESAPGAPVKMMVDALADQQKLTSQTNSIAILDAATIANQDRIVCHSTDEFLINAQSGAALATPTDRVTVSNFKVDYNRPHEHVRECKGSAGNSQPISSGTPPLDWTLSITILRPQDSTWLYAAQQGYEYKASYSVVGPVISGAVYKKITWNFPRLKIISDVQWDLANSGNNPMTVTFKGLVAAAAPAGMIAFDKYPSITMVNTRSTWGT